MAHLQIFPELSAEIASNRISELGKLLENFSLASYTEEEINALFQLLKPSVITSDEVKGISIKIEVDIRHNNRPPLIEYPVVLSLQDKYNRLTYIDHPNRWDINLGLWGDVEQNSYIRLYHDGDNSLIQRPNRPSFRKDSYATKTVAKYSIVKKTVESYYPQLAPLDTDCINWPQYKTSEKNIAWVNLGRIPISGPISISQFADMRNRLGMYRIARWLWLRDHDLRSS